MRLLQSRKEGSQISTLTYVRSSYAGLRRMPSIAVSPEEIAALEGISACRRSLNAAFEKERYHRRVASEKPFLTESHMQARLAFAEAHKHWTKEIWRRVVWTDEASFCTGGFGTVCHAST